MTIDEIKKEIQYRLEKARKEAAENTDNEYLKFMLDGRSAAFEEVLAMIAALEESDSHIKSRRQEPR